MNTDQNNKVNNVENPSVKTEVKPVVGARPSFGRQQFSNRPRPFGGFRGGPGGDRSKNPRKSFSGRGERVKPEFDQKILNIRRVTRVTKGGKRLNFSVAIVAGNKKGSVGIGTGKAGDTSLAIDKAFRNAKKNMITLSLTKTMSIPHQVSAKYCSGRVIIIPAPGRGTSAGSAARSVIEFAGIKDVMAKIVSPSKNKLNIARATVEALSVFDKRKLSSKLVTVKETADSKEIKKEAGSVIKSESEK